MPYDARAYNGMDRRDVEASLARECEKNPWLNSHANEDYDPHLDVEYMLSVAYTDTPEQLVSTLKGGNWALRNAFIWEDLAFVQQVNGGDEWAVFKFDPASGSWNIGNTHGSFGSVSIERMADARALKMVREMHEATPGECAALEYGTRSLEGWKRSGKDSVLDYLEVGDRVSDGLVEELMGTVPPVDTATPGIWQVGEPVRHVKGEFSFGKGMEPLFMTFARVGNQFYYAGECAEGTLWPNAEKLKALAPGWVEWDAYVQGDPVLESPEQQRTNTPFENLEERQKAFVLSDDADIRVRAAQAGLAMERLSHDAEANVREACVLNGYITMESFDDVPSVRAAIALQGDFAPDLIDDPDPMVQYAVARQGVGLETLIASPYPEVRKEVAMQRYGLDVLCNDPDIQVAMTAKTALSADGYDGKPQEWADAHYFSTVTDDELKRAQARMAAIVPAREKPTQSTPQIASAQFIDLTPAIKQMAPTRSSR